MSRRPSASTKTLRQVSKPTCSPEVHQVELLLPRRQPPPPPQKILIGPEHNLALLGIIPLDVMHMRTHPTC